MPKTRGRIVVIARALSPIIHGGDTVGNVQQVRRKTVYTDDGAWEVPFISGNSIKHLVRENATRFALEALGVEGGLTRQELQLLFSGGAMTKGGGSVRLDKAREAEEYFPALALCGYSAGNTMTESQVRVDHWEVVCAENANRLRAEVERYAPECLPLFEKYGSEFVSTEFGTRHETTRRRELRELLSEVERADVEHEISEKMTKKNAGKGDSLQMYYEHEVLVPGTVFVGGFAFPHGVTERELAAFQSAFAYASQGASSDGGLILHVGGQSSVGHGKVSVRMFGLLAEGIEPMTYRVTDDLVPDLTRGAGDVLGEYVEHLRENRDKVSAAIRSLS